MDVGAVVGADVDRIGVAPAQELEQVQLDLAVAAVEAGLAPVQQGLWAEGTQHLPRFAVRMTDVDHGSPHEYCGTIQSTREAAGRGVISP